MRNLIVLASILFGALLTTSVSVQARDFRVLSDQELSAAGNGSHSSPAEEGESAESPSEDKQQDVVAEKGEEPGPAGKEKKFPNPFIMGRGYENQGLNMATFEEQESVRDKENGNGGE